jgi:Ni/Fe-hydrogenase subunit HybB-like protein
VLTRGTIALGSMYSMLVVFVHLLVVSDLAMSLVPGWDSAVIPPYHAVSGFEASIALVVVLLAATRQLDPRLSRSCSKLLLSLALMWFYFVWCELLTYWYGRTPDEQSLLALFMLGPSGTLFGISAVCEFVVPLVVLVWNASRSNPITLSAVAAIVVIGNLIDRVRLYVPAWTVVTPTPTDHLPDVLPPLPLPGLSELIACVGVLAAVALVLVVAIRSFSAVSQWEVKAIDRLTPERPVLRTRTIVIARPS